MYYKVIYNNKVIDALDGLVYLKYQEKYNRMILCNESEAQAIFSSNREKVWHIDGLYDLPVSGYDTVRLEEIDEYDYKRLKVFGSDSIEDVIDNIVKNVVVDKEIDTIIESLQRLYIRQEIDEKMVSEICDSYSIAEESKNRILK